MVKIEKTDNEMSHKREALIRALRSGKWKEGVDRLAYVDENRGPLAGPGEVRYCPIGLGCALLGYGIRELARESDAYYNSFRLNYGVTDKQMRYLTCMNGGQRLRWPERNLYGATYGTDSPIIRSPGNLRDFKFTARFLEHVWGIAT